MFLRALLVAAACFALSWSMPAPSQRAAEPDAGLAARCADYADWLKPYAAGFEAGPDHGQYGPRHALAALAQFDRNRDPQLAQGIMATLRHYGDWVDREIARQGGVQSFEGVSLLALYRREFERAGMLRPADAAWFRATILKLRRHSYGLKPGDGPWRGSQHRGMVAATNDLIAAALYPDEPQAARWRRSGEAGWNDWWRYRDIGINDIAYFSDSLGIMLRAADVLGRDEVFRDAGVRAALWDRLVHETSPDGALVPYGVHAGWHGLAGVRIHALELAAARTGDGRYRFVARRLFDYARERGGFSPGQDHWAGVSQEAVALAALACDDRIAPVRPDSGSRVLQRPEIVRLTIEESNARAAAGATFDARMDMTARLLPSKVVLRSGWDRGDLFMLVEAYPRHDPLNPTAIYGLESYGASFAEAISERDTARENAVAIEDISGSARPVAGASGGGRRALPLGYAGMETAVEAFADDPVASLARLRVDNYGGFAVRQRRAILFVKNRFALVRDVTTFDEGFRARLGPVWNTQSVSPRRGENWLDTGLAAHWYNADLRLYPNRPGSLLVWYAPKPGARLVVRPMAVSGVPPEDQRAATRHFQTTQYAWQGETGRGTDVGFVSVLLPHQPLRDASALAGSIAVLRDDQEVSAVSLSQPGRWELAMLNPGGRAIAFDTPQGRLTSDARSLYLALGTGQPRFSLTAGTSLMLGTRSLWARPARADGSATG